MVSFKYIVVSAIAVVGVLAQDGGDTAVAQAAWDAIANDPGSTADVDTDTKRFVSEGRTNPPAKMKNPYWGNHCKAPYTEPPCETKCNRNNCFRSFLNARDGSEGKHCPADAFAFCCGWNHLPKKTKEYGINTGIVYKYFPYTKNCNSPGDKCDDVLDKIDDVCGCTLKGEVLVDVTTDYYKLKRYRCGDKHCKNSK